MSERNPCCYPDAPPEADCLSRERETYELLDDLKIPYLRIDHGPMATMEDCKEVDRILQVEIWKNLFLCNSQKTRFYLLVLPGSKRLVTKELSKQLGCARLSFAGERELWDCLRLTPGSVSIMGLRYDEEKRVRLVMDQSILQQEYFACHPCVNTSSIRCRTQDIFEKYLPYIGYEPVLVTV